MSGGGNLLLEELIADRLGGASTDLHQGIVVSSSGSDLGPGVSSVEVESVADGLVAEGVEVGAFSESLTLLDEINIFHPGGSGADSNNEVFEHYKLRIFII